VGRRKATKRGLKRLRISQLKRQKLVDVQNLTSHGFVESVEYRTVPMSLLSRVGIVAGEGGIDVTKRNGQGVAE